MDRLRKIFSKYTGFLRTLKPVYVVNNLLNRDKLKHNKELYKKYGIEKSVFGTLGSHDFKVRSEDIPWLDKPMAKENLEKNSSFQSFDSATQEQIHNFIDQGFMLLNGFYNEEEVIRLNKEVDRLLAQQKTDFNYTGKKVMDAYKISEIINTSYFRNERLLKLLNFVMGKKVVPFQTINFIEGSEQRAHSDSIHMTTEPEGYLIAVWVALEDTHEGNGPLFYFPKTHRLPYVTCQDYFSGNTSWQIGNTSYKNYEDKIEAIINEGNYEKKSFHAKKGDVFIWHANLLHGGSPITQKGATRKSMVAHYFCEDVICYHEISQRPALIDSKK